MAHGNSNPSTNDANADQLREMAGRIIGRTNGSTIVVILLKEKRSMAQLT